MSLRHGRPFVSIPGPSVIPDRVLAAMHRPMPNIYEGELVSLADSVHADLPRIARTAGHALIAVANGHGAWEMALSNTLSRGDKVLVLESGRFAIGWGEMATQLGIEVEVLNAPPRRPVNPAAVEARLAADRFHAIKAVLVVQIDTATSVSNDIAAIRRAIDAAGHPALYMVDCIASLACVPFEMDEWGVDVTVGGAQKGLMVPPGLGFNWVNERAVAAHAGAGLRTAYWDWAPRIRPGRVYERYCGTAPVQHLFALREALDMLDEEGLENAWNRHAALAGAVRAAVSAWAAPGGLEFVVLDPAARSNSVTTVLTNGIDAERLRAICETEAGLTLGVGLGEWDGRCFRIGHMGHLNPPMVLGTLGTVEAALVALGAPMTSSGVAAASAEIARAIAPSAGAAMARAGE